MNKTKREYCSKGHHPKWRAWKAKYSGAVTWKWVGNFCVYCGALVEDVLPDGSPRLNEATRLRILRS